jgi:hypothetical protein
VHQAEGLSILRPARLVVELPQASEDGPVLLDGLGTAPQQIGVRAGAVLVAAAPLTA